jgi:hypothetical protein
MQGFRSRLDTHADSVTSHSIRWRNGLQQQRQESLRVAKLVRTLLPCLQLIVRRAIGILPPDLQLKARQTDLCLQMSLLDSLNTLRLLIQFGCKKLWARHTTYSLAVILLDYLAWFVGARLS